MLQGTFSSIVDNINFRICRYRLLVPQPRASTEPECARSLWFTFRPKFHQRQYFRQLCKR